MYQVFDGFIGTDTWHTGHALDESRFFLALNQIVRDPDFSPDAMGDYLRSKLSATYDRDSNPFEPAVLHYVSAAWAVREFLAAIGELADI
jgi:hypothetical protein